MTEDRTPEVRADDAEQSQDWAELSTGAMAIAKGSQVAVEAAGGESAFGLALGEGANIAVDAAATGGELLAGDAIGAGVAIAGDVVGGAAAAELVGAAAFTAAAAPVVAFVAAGAAVVYGVDYLTDGALRDGAAAVGQGIDIEGDMAKLRALEPEAPPPFDVPAGEDL
jgi:hypothetical protein